jgi:hypothetical protein
VVVGADEADDIDFDPEPGTRRRKGPISSDKIRISQEEKSIYDLVDGTMSVTDIVEVSRLAEFDTNKALYELLTRDLIEEVRGQSAAAVIQQATPVDEGEVAETPVPLPLVLILVILAIASLITSFKNPLNTLRPLIGDRLGGRLSPVAETRKAISLQRIEAIGQAIEKYNSTHGRLPERFQELAPAYIAPRMLTDPWGHPYKYLPEPERYLVIGFTAEGKTDTDLFLQRVVGLAIPPTSSKQETGGIELIE